MAVLRQGSLRIGLMSAVPVEVSAGQDPTAMITTMITVDGVEYFHQVERTDADDLLEEPWYLDVEQMAADFVKVSSSEEAIGFLQRWGGFFPRMEEKEGRNYSLPLNDTFPYSCFAAWQSWFRHVRTSPWQEGFPSQRWDGQPRWDEYYPVGIINDECDCWNRCAVLMGKRTVLLDEEQEGHPRAPLVLNVDGSGSILDALASLVYAEHLAGLVKRACVNCQKIFTPANSRSRFCGTPCGLLYHKRNWAKKNRNKSSSPKKAPKTHKRREK